MDRDQEELYRRERTITSVMTMMMMLMMAMIVEERCRHDENEDEDEEMLYERGNVSKSEDVLSVTTIRSTVM